MLLLDEFEKQLEGEGRHWTALLFSLGLLQVAFYYLSAACVNGSGSLALAQPDTLLYCQSARRICEGHAFSYSVGTAVSTGTTSILYPFVLAIPYALGFVGEKIFAAGFALNALFYLIFIVSWSVAFRQWMKPKAASFASLLLVFFPQTAYCALAQSDMGLWMAVSGLFAAAFLSRKWVWAGLLLMVGPWVRPEGMVLALAVALVAGLSRRRAWMALAVAGLASSVGVFAFNGWLTGHLGFSSVANKGYFTLLPFASAVTQTMRDFIEIVRALFFGQVAGGVRALYGVPLVGAAAALIGLMTWKGSREQLWAGLLWLFVALGGVLIVAQSGWQGSNCDRYLAWLMPLLLALSGAGWWWAYERIKARHAVRAGVLLGLPFAFSLLSSVYLISFFHASGAQIDSFVRFGAEIEKFLPPKASLGAWTWTGLAYQLGDRRFAHLSGIYSPEFQVKEGEAVAEVLKNEPETRFGFLMLRPDGSMPSAIEKLATESVLVGPAGYEVRKVDWCGLDHAAAIPPCEGRTLVDRVDVGYEKDEKRADYETVQRYGMRPFELLTGSFGEKGELKVDVGRLVAGYDEMTVGHLQPGKDVFAIMRTANEISAVNETAPGERAVSKYSFGGHIGLHATVEGQPVACLQIDVATNGFSDVVMRIPGAAITSRSHRIGFQGDHATYGYWFYQ